MIDRIQLLEGSRLLQAAVKPWLASVSTFSWDGSEGYLPVIRRSILRRQFDALEDVVALVERERAYSAVPLLRSACEELLWIRYFNLLPSADASQLADLLITYGILRDLEAQTAEVGDKGMEEIGLLPVLKAYRSNQADLTSKLRQLGKRLGWPTKATKEGNPPSTWFIAGATDSTDIYRFLFHATSRYVHFSPVELARRGWGRSGRLELTSDIYEPIWAAFSLSWGTRLFGFTLIESLDALRSAGVPEPDMDALQVAFDSIAKTPLIPLVTVDELVWSWTADKQPPA
jgi:hypothetical protein